MRKFAFNRDFFLSAFLWILFVTTLSLSIDTHLSLRAAEGQLKALGEQTDPPPPGDTIVVLAGKVLGIGCFQIIPFQQDWEGVDR